MNAPLKRSIFDIINKNNLVFKLIIFAKIKSSKEIVKLIEESVKKYSNEITGLLLVNPNFIICLIESTEKTIYEFGSSVLNNKTKNFNDVKCFPIHFTDTGRFFSRWYSSEIIFTSSGTSVELDIKEIYSNVINNIYKFYWELKEEELSSEEKLDVLVKENSDRFPSVEILELLICNSWGYDLKSIIDSYYNNLEPEEDKIWPIQTIQSPPFNCHH